ncbi:hypothetical protein VTJ04DRAFT_721 [Mycothermus thermophilus]|uniref:uncharacterized protein n=1 Tax=Humicola insolens TaxID=85995 RepID=UPI0037421E6C
MLGLWTGMRDVQGIKVKKPRRKHKLGEIQLFDSLSCSRDITHPPSSPARRQAQSLHSPRHQPKLINDSSILTSQTTTTIVGVNPSNNIPKHTTPHC